jgi:hypothetical protein
MGLTLENGNSHAYLYYISWVSLIFWWGGRLSYGLADLEEAPTVFAVQVPPQWSQVGASYNWSPPPTFLNYKK